MSGLMKKRGREDVADEAASPEPKRFREAEQQILHLLEDMESEDRSEQEPGCVPSEEVLSGVIRSLEEEIGVSCSTSCESSDSLSRDGSVASDMTSGCGAAHGVDIDYLLGASDDELGILPSPVLDLDEEKGARNSFDGEGVPTPLEWENHHLKGLSSDNWHFEDDLVDYRQQLAYMDEVAAAWDVSHDAFFDGWRLEAAGGMY